MEYIKAPWTDDQAAPMQASAAVLLKKIIAPELAAAAAQSVAEELDRQACAPELVVKSAGGGVSFYFFGEDTMPDGSHRRYASIEADEDGVLTAVYKDRSLATVEIVEIPADVALGEAVKRVATFVQS